MIQSRNIAITYMKEIGAADGEIYELPTEL